MSMATTSTAAPVRVRHSSGRKVGMPTWFVLKPEAAPAIESAAYLAANGLDVLLTASSPDGDFQWEGERGRFVTHEKTASGGLGAGTAHAVCARKGESAVRSMNDALMKAKGTKTLAFSLKGGQRSAGMLLTAAVLLSGGNDVLFWTDGVKVRVLDMSAGE